MSDDRAPVGLIPAAGSATRLGTHPHSKEVLDVGGRPAASHLLERFRRGGIERAVIVVRPDKPDIEATLGTGEEWGVALDYLSTSPTPSVPHTLDVARTAIGERRVALGFPDILFEPLDAFSELVRRQDATGAELVLGLFPTDRPEKTDMVRLDSAGRPVELVIKDPECRLEYTWSIAVWSPRFTELLHRWLDDRGPAPQREPYVGDAIQSALEDGLEAQTVVFEQGFYLDIGTPEDLERARARNLEYGDRP